MSSFRTDNEDQPRVADGLATSPDDQGTSSAVTTGDSQSAPTIQTLYEGPFKCTCCKNWVTAYPDDLSDPVEENPEVKQKALVVRMRKSHDDDDGKSLVLDSIVVQSQSLKETIGEVFEGYSGITSNLKKLVFHAPFHSFYHRWDELEAILARQKAEDRTAAAFTQLLYNVLDNQLRDTITEVQDLVQHGVITYKQLWALFEPGELVVFDSDSGQRFFLVESCGYNTEKGFLAVTAKYTDWDGERFGYACACLPICSFEGTKPITELGVFPARFHKSRAEETKLAVERGRRFHELCGFHYMTHSGMARRKTREGFVSQSVDGRIIVDTAAYFEHGPESKMGLIDLNSVPIVPSISVSDRKHRDRWGHLRGDSDEQRSTLKRKAPASEKDAENAHPLTDEQLLLCPTHVRGFSLKEKLWAEFHVKHITEIPWNDGAYKHLELPNGLKPLVRAFIRGHFNNKKKPELDDIIKGKGLGMIIMLAGNPGTGKTLTAEAVADELKQPLYIMSAGELGNNAGEVEGRLKRAMALAEKWDALLLFDECDVFVQERSTTNLEQNEIVAVFLRLLEYYRGILIMTTNRVDTIDKAIHSRIHLTLHYPDLSTAAKESVWRQFVDRSGLEHSITDDEFARLARLPLNGRQIKNVVKVAVILTTEEGEEEGEGEGQRPLLGSGQIRTVLRATRESGEDCDF